MQEDVIDLYYTHFLRAVGDIKKIHQFIKITRNASFGNEFYLNNKWFLSKNLPNV